MQKVIVVAGPTAVGKTAYSIELAKKIDGEIVSLDSVQIYKGLDIGSAKITKEEMQGIPHYMISEIDPKVSFNVKEFKDMAIKYIEDILSRGKTPILVGGTGFYIRAVLYDTDFLYEDDEKASLVREKLYDELELKGIDYMYEKLAKVDKESIKKIPKENERRVIRALEFYELHNMPISKHNEEEKAKKPRFDYDFYVLTYKDREKLYDRINKRVDMMIENGLLEEIRKLIDNGVKSTDNSMKSIGYKELYDYVKNNNHNKNNLEEIISEIKKHTRNYAKRQLTWFRSQENISWVMR